jgi:hypothetical protein
MTTPTTNHHDTSTTTITPPTINTEPSQHHFEYPLRKIKNSAHLGITIRRSGAGAPGRRDQRRQGPRAVDLHRADFSILTGGCWAC